MSTRRRRTERGERTRSRITAAVRELLAEGGFHESSVEQVAERAGVSRATLYQHFPSRLDLVDAICDDLALNPALVAIREVVDVDELIGHAVRFWSSEDAVLEQLYEAAAVDPAARDFVDRQRADRRDEVERVARHTGLGRRELALLLVLTSYETFRELRRAGLGDRQIADLLRASSPSRPGTAARPRSGRAARTRPASSPRRS
jgi:AcrR family transcriptional regulator